MRGCLELLRAHAVPNRARGLIQPFVVGSVNSIVRLIIASAVLIGRYERVRQKRLVDKWRGPGPRYPPVGGGRPPWLSLFWTNALIRADETNGGNP